MIKTIKLTDSLSAEVIDGNITQFEKVAGSSMYTTIYSDGASVRIGSNVSCEAGWNIKACVLHYKYHPEPIVFWYEINGGKRVFPDLAHFISLEEMLDQKYGEVFHCDIKKGGMNLLAAVLGIISIIVFRLITGKMIVGFAAGLFLSALLFIINSVRQNFSLKKGWPEMYELLKKLAAVKVENI